MSAADLDRLLAELSHPSTAAHLPDPIGDRLDDEPAAPTVYWMCNHDDERSTVHYLADVARHGRLDDPRYQPVVLRPTPGTTDRSVLALDLLLALGKSPRVLDAEHLRGDTAWRTAEAWLLSAQVTHLFVDRAHQLPVAHLLDLVRLAQRITAVTVIVWSHLDLHSDAHAVRTLRAAGHTVARYWPHALRMALPLPTQQYSAVPERLPRLPQVDFTTFRAACRRHLGPAEFARVDALYCDAAARTEAFLDQYIDLSLPASPPLLHEIAVDLVGWLRDVHLGPAVDERTALVVLRGTQAALFCSGILLRWQPDALGPDPAARLPGTPAPGTVIALTMISRTDHAAATALSLHLNQSPRFFACLRHGDVTADGARITAHQHDPPPQLHPEHGWVLANPDGRREVACEGGIDLPPWAQPVLRAHLAYGRLLGADDSTPLFFKPDNISVPIGPDTIRNAVARTCERLNITPNWLHPGTCRYGADIGLNHRTQGWLIERSLTLHQLDPALAARAIRWPRHADER